MLYTSSHSSQCLGIERESVNSGAVPVLWDKDGGEIK